MSPSISSGHAVAAEALSRSFFDRPVLEVAPDLLGCIVEHESADGVVGLRLTEVEAYDGAHDPGSHAFRGITPRNAVMFGPAGHVYVYFTYGMHWCMNLVCGPQGSAAAVLLRAGEVVEGVDLASARRTSAQTARDLARGPARLTLALGIDGTFNGTDATMKTGRLRVRAATPPITPIRSGPRVGVAGTGAPLLWRVWIEGEPTVSAYRPAVPRRRKTPAPEASPASPRLVSRPKRGSRT